MIILPGYLVYAGVVYWFFSLYVAKWRFASLPDLWNIFRAVTVLAFSLLVLDYVLVSPNFYGTFFFGKITIALYWVLQMFFLGGPRIAYRLFRHARTQQPRQRSGRHSDAGGRPRRRRRSSAARHRERRRDQDQAGRNPVAFARRSGPGTARRSGARLSRPIWKRPSPRLAAHEIHVARLVLTPTALAPDVHPETMLMLARRLGLATSRLPSLEAGEEALRLAPVARRGFAAAPEREDRLPAAGELHQGQDRRGHRRRRLDRLRDLRSRRQFRRRAGCLILENSESALHAVLERLAAKSGSTTVEGRIADIRDRERIIRLIAEAEPNLVFHAAALKHVPLVEREWDEGIRTNVLGSINVADAALAAGAEAMVMISTDKAIEPVSVLGATKRLAEMYCQALDAAAARTANGGKPPIRMIAVRFGNVLASNGSVVPKFKAQIEAGGPVTVTHPDMVRYFMTIREACDLVITAASHALGPTRTAASVYVLNMGQPIKIVDLAERMIRLSGLEPGRDVDIVFTGIRPGERLNEILFAREEPSVDIGIPGVVAATPVCPPVEVVREWVAKLQRGLDRSERSAIVGVLREAVPDFRSEAR